MPMKSVNAQGQHLENESLNLLLDLSLLEKSVSRIALSITPASDFPKQYEAPSVSTFIARSERFEIPPDMWKQIKDPIYREEQKSGLVKAYYAVQLLFVKTNDLQVMTIPAKVTRTMAEETTITATVTNLTENSMSIGTCIGAKYSGLSAELETTFQTKNVYSESVTKIQRSFKELTIEAVSYNRLYVPWVFSRAILLYRERKKASPIALIASSEWAFNIFDKMYEIPQDISQ